MVDTGRLLLPRPFDRAARALILGLLGLPLAVGQPPSDDKPPPLPRKDFAGAQAHAVLSVPAGNTVVIRLDGKDTTVRLIGVHVPQAGGEADEPQRFLARLLQGESIYVEYETGWPPRDDEQRVWAYVYRAPDGLFVNLELVRQGYARVAGGEPFRHESLLRAYEKLAQKSQRGLWGVRAGPRSTSAPASQPATRAARGSPSDPPDPDDNVIVYATPSGKKYHRRDCQHVRNGATALTLKEAKAKGLTPCARCKPPP